MKSRQWKIQITQLVIWNILLRCDAANHYCVNGHPIKLVLDDLYNRDETIVPSIPDEPVHKRLRGKLCHWDVEINAVGRNLQLVLEGLPSTDETRVNATGASMNASLVVTFPHDKTQLRSSIGMFHVYPLAQRKHFSVEASWDPRFELGCPVNLRILVPIAGASRDMLSFHGNRYTVSQTVESVAAAASNIKGSAQLASFSSMDQVKEFVAANNAKMNDFPYKRPLELSQGVRLGLFYRVADDAVLSLVRDGKSCQLMPIERQSFVIKSPIRGVCSFLRDSPDSSREWSPEIEFGDCARPAPTLMSFSETAAADAAETDNLQLSCRDQLSRLVQESSQKLSLRVTEPQPRGNPPPRHSNAAVPIVICLAIFAVATAVILTAVCWKSHDCPMVRCIIRICSCTASQRGSGILHAQYSVRVIKGKDSAQCKQQYDKCSTCVEFSDTVN